MTIVVVVAVALILAAVLAFRSAGRRGGRQLGVGDPAPPFSLPGSDGRTHSLADHLGREAVALAWFPKAFTGG